MTDNPIIAKFMALAHLVDTDANLIVINETYMLGQFIVALDDAGRKGLKIGDWDWENEPKSSGTPYADLDWFIPPSESGAGRLTPFEVANTDEDKYAVVDGNAVITDTRLVGYSGYPVWSTSRGREFRKSELDYANNADGVLTIIGFTLDDPDDHITIILPTSMGAEISIIDIDDRLAALEAAIAPFIPLAPGQASIGKVWWPGTIDTVPAGWQECVEMRGCFPMAQDPEDVYNAMTNPSALGRAVGTPGGSKAKIVLAPANMPKITIGLPTNDGHIDGGGDGRYVGMLQTSAQTATVTIGNETPTGIDKMNPYLIGLWIEYKPA